MKNFVLILLCISFISCNPFISKDLRRKNRANRKLERLTTKFPNLLKKDTAIISYDTTIITPNSKADTVFTYDFDTITLFKDKLRLELIKINDTLIVDAECLPDTIRIKEFIQVPFNKVSKIKLTQFERFSNLLGKYVWQILLILAILLGFRLIYKMFI